MELKLAKQLLFHNSNQPRIMKSLNSLLPQWREIRNWWNYLLTRVQTFTQWTNTKTLHFHGQHFMVIQVKLITCLHNSWIYQSTIFFPKNFLCFVFLQGRNILMRSKNADTTFLTCSWHQKNETTNSPFHQFKVLQNVF